MLLTVMEQRQQGKRYVHVSMVFERGIITSIKFVSLSIASSLYIFNIILFYSKIM